MIDKTTWGLWGIGMIWCLLFVSLLLYIRQQKRKADYKQYLLMEDVHNFHNKPGAVMTYEEWLEASKVGEK